MPRISVLMPYRHASATLRDAAESVLSSDVDLELVAVDDNSTDAGSADRAQIPDNPRVVHVATGGVGIARALEAGRRHCRAEFIARMDADDLSLPGRFEAQLEALRDQSLAVVGAQAELFGEKIGEGMQRYVTWQNALLDAPDHHHHIFVESPLCHPSAMIRARALEEVGGYRDGDFPEDYDLWLRFDAAGFGLAKLDQVGVRWRQSSTQATYNDERYRRDAFRALKARFLAARIKRLRAGRPLVVFGAGANGKRLLRLLEPAGLRAHQWVDVDPRRIGNTARGAPIVAFGARVSDAFVLIAISDHRARAGARALLEADGAQIERDYLLTS